MANIYVSSGTSFSATISITYPAGSTCTVSNYKKTWTAPNTTGSWTFKAHEVGIYTVKAVSGSKNDIVEVIITTNGQVKTVKLVYELVLFKDGAYQDIGSFNNATITNGNLVMSASGTDGAGGSISRTFITNKKLDLTNYSTLTFSLASFTINSEYPSYRKAYFGVCSETVAWEKGPDDTNIKAKTILTNTDQGTNKTVTVDVSALTGSFYVFVNYNLYGSMITTSKSIIITKKGT